MTQRFPHNAHAFTQGLDLVGDTLYESSGLYGASYIAKYSISPYIEERQIPLPRDVFAEGLAAVDDRVLVLTWREGQILNIDPHNDGVSVHASLDQEGWGICTIGAHLLTTNGNPEVQLRDRKSTTIIDRIMVSHRSMPIAGINDVAWLPNVDRVVGNVDSRDYLVVFHPRTGQLESMVDCRALRTMEPPRVGHLNGVTVPCDQVCDEICGTRLLVTGKNWTHLYEITLDPLDPSEGTLLAASLPMTLADLDPITPAT